MVHPVVMMVRYVHPPVDRYALLVTRWEKRGLSEREKRPFQDILLLRAETGLIWPTIPLQRVPPYKECEKPPTPLKVTPNPP